MLLEKFLIFLGCLIGVMTRDLKFSKPMPAISNSLVNFGKMDISFYLNDKFKDLFAKRDSPSKYSDSLSSSYLHDSTKEETCPCSSLRNLKDPISSNPSEMLNKILMSNDLFSFNKEFISSSLCCDSHENIQEEGLFFEFSPRQNQMVANPMPSNPMLANPMLTNPMQMNQQLMPSLTRILENVFPRRPTIPVESVKPAIDIFLFPKKKSVTEAPQLFFPLKKSSTESSLFLVPKKKSVEKSVDFFLNKKTDIHPVGDNEINKAMKPISLTPAITNKPSVKKDLGTKNPLEEKETNEQNDVEKSSTKI